MEIKNSKVDIYNKNDNKYISILKNIKIDLTFLYKESLDKQDLIFEGIKKLNGISLNKNKFIYTGESYKELIEFEKCDKSCELLGLKKVEYFTKMKHMLELSKKENNI